jgi:hypothetical protein
MGHECNQTIKVFPDHTPCIVHGVLVGASDLFFNKFYFISHKRIGKLFEYHKIAKKNPW